MKKLLLILLCFQILFISCEKEEESNNSSNNNLSIVGLWKADSALIYLSSEEFTLTGQSLYFFDTLFTRPPEYIGISGNMQFTEDGVAIIEFVNNIDTGNYSISANVFSHYESDGDLAVFDYSLSYTNLILSRSISETYNYVDGYEIFSRQETLYLSKQ